MKVLRAQCAGACYGVQRALDAAFKANEGHDQVFTWGALIHNPQVVEELEREGIEVARSMDQLPEGSTVIVRSHGVPPSVMRALEGAGASVVDATCPYVARAQKAAARLAREGCRVIIVGEAGHPEVEGIAAFAAEAGGKADVVGSPGDVPAGLYDPIGVVVQTTQRRENLDAVLEQLKAQGLEPRVMDTICAATAERQASAAQVAAEADAMVVIGGRNSSNTTRLAEICAAAAPRTYHVESAAELDPAWFADCATVGVTAGASTPESQIHAVEQALQEL
ncbi:4-hydroxy-3-methylbut-2-enyl diphosphate reductase [Parvibacter caecicola]|uniref:4-hydroxy-3-methylbut-2-enyl diphosphate reductase n=1 Tax=Parvibacter caecicola TaxID=747645 RepID=A0A4T9TD02_9ACTN|nr:4-hydroxy-3-methylbut-2-enyl diphosphate reductase [Parvibacter caecicola]TJW12194.1 4-hydroxy-3-methylbut-2-enyl diphosphate reductase [Parvibacter caecicola]